MASRHDTHMSGWLDVHGHFYLPKSDAGRHEQIQAFRAGRFMVGHDWQWNLADSLKYMDQAGVQMQMLSYVPQDLDELKKANDFAAEQVRKHPTRFGQLAALPTDNAEACLGEIDRAVNTLKADGFAVTGCYKGVYFGDPSLEAVWQRLDELEATVHIHPNAYAGPTDGRPSPLIDVAFETTRVATDIVYRGLLLRYKKIRIILAHCGGALPVLSGRLTLLGAEKWVPNEQIITSRDIREQLSRFYVDTAASAETGIQPAVNMAGISHVVYGADCGVPCSTVDTMEANRASVQSVANALGYEADRIGLNGFELFPSAKARLVAVPV